MRKYRLNLWFIYVLLLLLGLPSWAAEEKIKVTGDSVWGDTKKKMTFVEGNVRIVQGSTIINTQNAEIDLDKKLAFLKNHVKLVHPDLIIEAEILDYDLRKKSGTFKEKVVMKRLETKNKSGEKAKDPFSLTAEEIYFESNTKNFIAKNKGSFSHKDFSGTADRIEYSDAQQELVFSENAFLKRPEGEEIRGDSIKINLQDRSFTVKNNVSINFDVEEDEDTQTTKKSDK